MDKTHPEENVENEANLAETRTEDSTITPPDTTVQQPTTELLSAAETPLDITIEVGTSSLKHQPISHKKRTLLSVFFVGIFLIIGAGTTYGLLLYHGSFSKVTAGGVVITRTGDKQSQITALTEQLKTVTFTVQGKGGATTVYNPIDAGIDFDPAATITNARTARGQGSLLQRLQWWRSQEISMVFGVDKLTLDTFVDEKLTQIDQQPVNATLTVEGTEVRLTAEKPGTGYRVTGAHELILIAAKNAQAQELVLIAQPIPATTTLKDIEPLKAKIVAALAEPITFVIKGVVYAPSKATIGSWVEPMTTDTKTNSLLYNSGEIEAYLDKIAKPHTRLVRNELTMKGSDGNLIILVGGQDGTDITGKQEVAKDVASKLLDPQPINIELTVSEIKHTVTAAESYEKWLVADITGKRMDAYEKDVLVKSFAVSAGAPATPTVIGMFKVHGKTRKQNMRGYNADGSTYFQPNVEWNLFFQGSYAIHGNYWRPADWFGRVNSSHGCIGLRNADAQWVYEWAPVGTPVITHL